MGYSWARIFGLYHPCILLSGLTHAWSIWIFAVCIFEYIMEYWAQWCDLPDFAMLWGHLHEAVLEAHSTPSPSKVMSG